MDTRYAAPQGGGAVGAKREAGREELPFRSNPLERMVVLLSRRPRRQNASPDFGGCRLVVCPLDFLGQKGLDLRRAGHRGCRDPPDRNTAKPEHRGSPRALDLSADGESWRASPFTAFGIPPAAGGFAKGDCRSSAGLAD